MNKISHFLCFIPTELNQFHRCPFIYFPPAWFNSSWVLLAQWFWKTFLFLSLRLVSIYNTKRCNCSVGQGHCSLARFHLCEVQKKQNFILLTMLLSIRICSNFISPAVLDLHCREEFGQWECGRGLSYRGRPKLSTAGFSWLNNKAYHLDSVKYLNAYKENN